MYLRVPRWLPDALTQREIPILLLSSVLAVALGASIALGSIAASVAIAVAGGLVLLVLPVSATVAAFVIAFLLPLTQVGQGVDTRYIAPAIMVLLAARAVATRRVSLVRGVGLRLLPLGAVAIASLMWSEDGQATGDAVLALATVVAFLVLIPLAMDARQVGRLLRWLLSTLIVVSAVVSISPLGQLAGRSRGIFVNPNALAILLALAVPLLMRERWRLLVPVAVILSVTSASRAGVLGLAVGITMWAITVRVASRVPRSIAILLIGLSLAIAILNLAPAASSDFLGGDASRFLLLRFQNSREFEWGQALRVWQDSPLIGHGFGALKIETGNSFMKVLVDLGILGLVVALPFVLLLGRILFTSQDRVVVGVTAAGLVSSFFEAWLLTAGSAFFVIFCLAIEAESEPHDGPADHRHADAAARPGVGATGAHCQQADPCVFPLRP